MNPITLLDLAIRTGIDMVVGAVDNATRFCPEVSTIIGRTISGTSYDANILIEKGRGAFRLANEGVETTKSKYSKVHIPCFIFDSQMAHDKALADVHPSGVNQFLSEETLNTTEGSFETLAEQFYYGESAGSKGFNGLQASTPASLLFNAGGATADSCTSIYLIFNDVRGTHFVFGKDGDISGSDDWRQQQVKDASGNAYTAYVNGMTFWIGLQTMPFSVARIANIDLTANGIVTDAKIAKALEAFPMRSTPNAILMPKRAALRLQESRSASGTSITSGAKTSKGTENWAPEPTESNGIPIVRTEGIRTNEPVVSF